MSRPTAAQLRAHLGLAPLPHEGGFFAETYRRAMPEAWIASGTPSTLATAIYYLLTPDTFSALHRLAHDEIYHHYLGDPVELVQLHPDGRIARIVLGKNVIDGGHALQCVVPAGVWQGSRLLDDGRADSYALLGTTMAPGFDFADFELGARDALTAAYPNAAASIAALTRA
ncbi:MAG: cupin domain-containing protein [Acidobacteriota bacterium]